MKFILKSTGIILFLILLGFTSFGQIDSGSEVFEKAFDEVSGKKPGLINFSTLLQQSYSVSVL